MEALWDKIDEVRLNNTNTGGKHFIPETSLFRLLSMKELLGCLDELDVAGYVREELANSIFKSGRKCFAILLQINQAKKITAFFSHDSMQDSGPDHRLPYAAEPLRRILGANTPDIVITRFLKEQWGYMAPVLRAYSVFRRLETSVILPYVSERPVGSGSMGDVWLVEIHPECHRLPIERNQVVRKELRPCENESMEKFELELKNLSLLAHLNHPNIVKLHYSYIYMQRCNLVFDVADGGTLAEMLDGRREGSVQGAQQLLLSLADLASAIASVHNFVSDRLDLALTGCHHDLSPRNILVKAGTFLLADFGMSTLRSPDEDSLTWFKDIRGSYVAPECQYLDSSGRIKSGRVGRASDVWSFGCILSEILTYVLCDGPVGVKKFRSKRTIEFAEGVDWPRFHAGPGRPHPFVEEWLKDLENKGKNTPWCHWAIRLVRWTLKMEPSQRPTANQVSLATSGIHVLALAGEIEEAWAGFLTSNNYAEHVLLEKFRFQSWLSAFREFLELLESNEFGNTHFEFGLIRESLTDAQRILVGSQDKDGTSDGFRQRSLRQCITVLVQKLPSKYKATFREHLLRHAMQVSDMDELKGVTSAMNTHTGPERDIGTLLAVRRLVLLSDKGKLSVRNDLVKDRNDITLMSELDAHSLARFKGESDDVVVEWLTYDSSWANEVVSSRRRDRLALMTGLLNDQSTSALPGTLHCRGFFHDPDRNSFGLVYRKPIEGATPHTLYRLLTEKDPGLAAKRSSPRFRPPLEYRFKLAAELCRCIHTLHTIKWLHRNIHSTNVLCFQPKGARNAEAAGEPRLVGLGASREDNKDPFTQGHDDNAQLRNYHHPKYLAREPGEPYRAEFDIYSLGMVLLEIGLWTPLSKLARKCDGLGDERFGRAIIDEWVTQLDLTMGTSYMEATRWCLECYWPTGPESNVEASSVGDFKKMVMEKVKVA